MRYYEATSTIDASAEAVWAVLVDGSQAAPGRAFPVTVTSSFQQFAAGLKRRVESGG